MQEMEKGEVVEMREVEFGGFYCFYSLHCLHAIGSHLLIVLVLNISEQLN